MQKAKQKHPNFNEERKRWRRGYRVVVGLDEAGRGPLAGPVCAAAVCFFTQKQTAAAKLKIFKGIKDSKKLSTRQREEWYKILTQHHDIKWGIGIVSEKIIDKVNIFEATKLAMKKAITDLEKNYRMIHDRESYDNLSKSNKVDFLILDGNFTLEDLNINQRAIVKADEKVFSCAAASIIAKVTRDRILCRYAKKYPQYGFEKHKGYGTLAHRRALQKYGPCKIHRRSFRPMKDL